MKKIFAIILLISAIQVNGQKKVLDTSTFENWPIVNAGKITANGNFVAYIISNEPQNSSTLVIKATNTNWERKIIGISAFNLSGNSIIYKLADSLSVIDLVNGKERKIGGVSMYNLHSLAKHDYLFYISKDSVLSIENLSNGKKYAFRGVKNYFSSRNGHLVLQRKGGLYLAFLEGKKEQFIYSEEADKVIFDNSGNQVAFTSGIDSKVLYYYNTSTAKAEKLENNLFSEDLTLSSIDRFSHDGSAIFLTVKRKAKFKNKAIVDVWSYTDVKLFSQTELEKTENNFLSVYNINDKSIVQLQYYNEQVRNVTRKTDAFVFFYNTAGPIGEKKWNPSSRTNYFMADSKTGIRKRLKIDVQAISGDENYIIGFDSLHRNLCSYDIKTEQYHNLTNTLPIPLSDDRETMFGDSSRNIRLAGWDAVSKKALVYDRFDIWSLDVENKKPPICLTNGYGRNNNIIFRLLSSPQEESNTNNGLIISAFDNLSKDNGFYKLNIKSNPEKLSMGECFFTFRESVDVPTIEPIKADNRKIFLLKKQSTHESSNYVVTVDFKTFHPVSNTYPEKKYLWHRSKLLTFDSLNGEKLNGVLYYPEDLDSSKKYPVVIHYYEKMSQNKNVYHKPEGSQNDLNIAWFTSKGYLVFTPDINYQIGFPGPSALNSIIGSANALIKLSFVDENKIGLFGHSFGGYETNFIITHSKMFACAFSSSGFCDLVSAYGSIIKGGYNFMQFWAETGQGRIAAGFSERPDLYIRNSPVFYVKDMNTPLLMMNNKEDGVVNFSQGLEFFTQLRRLQKPVWLLQYNGEGHTLIGKLAVLDRTEKVDAFFNYFLNNGTRPSWLK